MAHGTLMAPAQDERGGNLGRQGYHWLRCAVSWRPELPVTSPWEPHMARGWRPHHSPLHRTPGVLTGHQACPRAAQGHCYLEVALGPPTGRDRKSDSALGAGTRENPKSHELAPQGPTVWGQLGKGQEGGTAPSTAPGRFTRQAEQHLPDPAALQQPPRPGPGARMLPNRVLRCPGFNSVPGSLLPAPCQL